MEQKLKPEEKLIKDIMESKVKRVMERMNDPTPVALTLTLGQWMHLAYLGFAVEKETDSASLKEAIELLRRQVRDAARLAMH